MRLQTLGGLKLEGINWRRPKPLLLLAYLALEGPQPRRYLADLFYADTLDPRDSLSSALRLLRQALPGSVVAEVERVTTSVPCDAAELLGLLSRHGLQDLTTDYPGPFLAGLDLALSEELEEWVFGTREYLGGRVREACIRLGQKAAQAGAWDETRNWAEAALRLREAAELPVADFPVVHYLLREGRSPLVSGLEREAAELGLRLELRVAEMPVALGRQDNWAELPAPTDAFVGRDVELNELTSLLGRDDCRLLTLHGGGGVGKTRLALELGQRLTGAGRRIVFVPLEAVTASAAISGKLAEALRLAPGPETDPLGQIAAFLQHTEVLVIFDNVEQFVAEAEVFQVLLQRCVGLKLLVTSRERLARPGEWVYALDGLPLDEEAATGSALDLFALRAQSVRRTFVMDAKTRGTVTRICQLVGGYPLALELAAGWTHLLSVGKIAQELESGWAVLTAGATVSGRHASMEATFEYSFRLLSSLERSVFRCLGVFAGAFTRAAAGAVSGASLFQLARFADASLLTSRPDDRFALHPMLQRFAEQKAQESGEQEEVRDRHAAHFGRVVAERVAAKAPPRALEPDIPDILRALAWHQQRGSMAEVVDIMVMLTGSNSYYAARGHTPDSLTLLRAATKAARHGPRAQDALQLLTNLGNHYLHAIGDIGAAASAFREALTCAQVCNDTYREVVLLSLLGVAAVHQGDAGAERLLETAYVKATMTDDALAQAHVRGRQGYLTAVRGDWLLARELLLEARAGLAELALERPDDPEVATTLFFTLCNLGEAEAALGDLGTARAAREDALGLAQARDNKVWAAHAHRDLAELGFLTPHPSTADHFRQALDLYRRQGHYAEFKETEALWRQFQGVTVARFAE